MSAVSFHPDAYLDLDEMWDYIATDSRQAADRVVKEIRDAIDMLQSFPGQGHTLPNVASKPILFHLVRDYLIAYTRRDTTLIVLGIFHGRRNPRTIAALLRHRT